MNADQKGLASMWVIFLSTAKYLVGGNLLLVIILLRVDVSDQDATYVLALLVWLLNWPALWTSRVIGVESNSWALLAGGTIQWALISAAIALLVSKRISSKKKSEAGLE